MEGELIEEESLKTPIETYLGSANVLIAEKMCGG